VIGLAGHPFWAGYGFDTHLDAILFGSALAIAANDGWQPKPWMLHPLTLLLSVAFIEGLPLLLHWPGLVIWGTSVCAFPLLLVLIYVVAKPPRLLNNPVAKFCGNISYSLYLYHLLVIYLLRKVHFSHSRYQFVAMIVACVLAATVS
jgi:peptidoglycan/LPS O-acetylase OafA/YrhL